MRIFVCAPNSGGFTADAARLETSTGSVPRAIGIYIEKYGGPKTLESLTDHCCLQPVTPVFPGDKWQFDGPNGRESVNIDNPVFRGKVPEAMAIAIRQGLGIGFLLHSPH